MNLLDNLSGSGGGSISDTGSYLSERSYQAAKNATSTTTGTTTTTVEHIKNGTITTTTINGGYGNTSSTNFGQGQIELVEKILNQISLHQTASSGMANSGSASNSAATATGQAGSSNNNSQSMAMSSSIMDSRPPAKISYSKKIINCGGSGGGTSNNGTGPSSSSGGSGGSYHHYQHLDSSNSYSAKAKFRTNLPKYSQGNNHHADQQVQQQKQSSAEEAQDSQCAQCEYYFIDGQIIPKTECNHQAQHHKPSSACATSTSSTTAPAAANNNPSRIRMSDNFSPKTTHPKPHYNRNKINNQQQPQLPIVYLTRNRPNLNNSNNNSISEPPRPSHPRQCIIQKNKCQDVKKFVEAQIVFDQNIIDIVPVHQSNPTAATGSDQKKDNDSKPTELDIKAEVVMKATTVNEPAKRKENSNGYKNGGGQCQQPSVNAETSKSKDIKPANSTRNLSPQTVKKIRCLIANFITIQVDEDDVSDNNSALNKDASGQDDILSSIDCEKLGFQNFDGKNIGLYKNIGYINRNKTKFVRPTRDLLHLLVHGKILQKYDEALVSDIDLYQFYDNHNPKSYMKKFAYSILDSLINEDDNLMRQIRTRCYRYPDCEYSSDGDDYMNSFEPFGGGNGATIYPKNNNESGILDNALISKNYSDIANGENAGEQQPDRDADVVVISCNKEIIIPGNMQRGLKEQRKNGEAIATTIFSSSDITLLQQQLLNSYFITEVSFSC